MFLAKHCGELSPRGIPQTARQVTLPLSQVYVSLTAERETERIAANFEPAMMTQAGKYARRLQQQRAQAARSVERVSEKIDLPRAITSAHRAVILGDPGAGKTTLTKFLATRFAEACLKNEPRVTDAEGHDYGETRLPILLRIAKYADAFRKNRSLSLREFLAIPFSDGPVTPPELTALFENALKSGEAYVLLDGLDEVADSADRIEIARQIETFTLGMGQGCRILVTSRIAGYREARLAAGFVQYTLRDMEREQIEKFLRRWCVAVERFHSPDADDAELHTRGNVESDAILREMDRNEGVRRLAKNPLLLTILALIHRNGARLPERRIDLYETASKTLLEDWRLANAGGEARIVKEYEALELLGPLAYWMHENEPTGLIAEKDAKALLAQYLGEQRNLKPNHPDVQAGVEDFLRRVREHSGLFVERAPGEYGFMHLTFEEYFAARHITADFFTAAERIFPYRHKPRWQEPIRLAIAYERPRNAAHLVRTAILAEGAAAQAAGYAPSEYEAILHRDLLLAARCIGDCAGVEATLAHAIAQRLIAILLHEDATALYEPLRQQVWEILPSLAGGEVGTEVAAALTAAFLKSRPGGWSDLAQALKQLGQATPEALAALSQAMQDEDSGVRLSAAGALKQLGGVTPEALAVLLQALMEEDWRTRENAAEALGQLEQGTPEVQDALLQAMKDEDEEVRRNAASALGQLGQATPEVLAALLLAMKDKQRKVRLFAVGALGELGQATPEVLAALFQALEDKHSDVWLSTVLALVQLGQATPEVQDALLQAMKDEDIYTRYGAAFALRKLGLVTPEVLGVLMQALQDFDWLMRGNAAEALGQLGQATPEILAALMEAVQDEDWYVRNAAWQALWTLVETREAQQSAGP